MVVPITVRSPRQHLADLAARALRATGGKLDDARQLVTTWLQADPSLLAALIDEVVAAAVEASVGVEHRAANRVRFAQAASAAVPPATVGGIVSLVLMEVMLGYSGGIRLREATRQHLRKEQHGYQAQANTMTAKATFFAAVAEALPDEDTRVGDVLTEEQLRALLARTHASL